MLTLQHFLDRNYQYFIVEKNPPGRNPNTGGCYYYFYQDGKTCRCAIGCALTIEQAMGMEACGGSIQYVAKTNHLTFKCSPSDIPALRDLQLLHDRLSCHPDFHALYERGLREWAKQHYLKWPGDKDGGSEVSQ